MDVHFRFTLQEIVWIPELETNGTVKAIFMSAIGTQYDVRYFHAGEAKMVYFFEEELEEVGE